MIAFLAIESFSATAYSAINPRRSLSAAEIFKKFSPAVVRIEVLLHGASLGIGSGFFISKNGEIATSLHVIRPWLLDAKTEIQIKLINNVTIGKAQVGHCGDTRGLDLCFLKVEYQPKSFLPLTRNQIQPGEPVVTIGHPRGLDFSISTGIISGVRQNKLGWREIQIDAAISPGNSGGPIINYQGQIVGVVYQFEQDGQNLNFGITTNELIKLKSLAPTGSAATYRSIAPARSYYLEQGQIKSKLAIQSSIEPALIGLHSNKSNHRPNGLKWMKFSLDNRSFISLLPDIFQNCVKVDESPGVSAMSCSSTNSDFVLTIQKRPHLPQGKLLRFRNKRLVAPRTLAIVDQLESDGTWEDIKQFEDSFLSRPTKAQCNGTQQFGDKTILPLSAEIRRQRQRIPIRENGFFQDATGSCSFETANDTDPGALSVSRWVETKKELYGINIWLADPAKLSYADAIIDLLIVSAGHHLDSTLKVSANSN